MQDEWCWVKPGGHLQLKPPMTLTQRNWQLCCLVEHSSRSAGTRTRSQFTPLRLCHLSVPVDARTTPGANPSVLPGEGQTSPPAQGLPRHIWKTQGCLPASPAIPRSQALPGSSHCSASALGGTGTAPAWLVTMPGTAHVQGTPRAELPGALGELCSLQERASSDFPLMRLIWSGGG